MQSTKALLHQMVICFRNLCLPVTKISEGVIKNGISKTYAKLGTRYRTKTNKAKTITQKTKIKKKNMDHNKNTTQKHKGRTNVLVKGEYCLFLIRHPQCY